MTQWQAPPHLRGPPAPLSTPPRPPPAAPPRAPAAPSAPQLAALTEAELLTVLEGMATSHPVARELLTEVHVQLEELRHLDHLRKL